MQAVMDHLQRDLGAEFQVVRPLGSGAVAQVFLARERALDRLVAIKVLRRSLAMDEVARKRFLREARLAARIHHPNVVAIHRVGELESDGRPYLVMEYIDGQTFEEVLAAVGPLPEEEVRHVIGEVCRALAAAHALGIIHRDVRPGNIMRTHDGERIVLADFGLAGILETGGDAVTRLTGSGQILGHVGHAPPEQLNGGTIRPGSDIYAVAVTAYELMTGSGPFPDAKRTAQKIQAHLNAEPTPIRHLRASATPELEDLLLRALHKRPDRRPGADLLEKRLAGPGAGAGVGAAAYGGAHGGVGGGPGSAGGGPNAVPGTAVESFLAELRRRRVYKVGAGYGAFVLIVLAVVDGALPALPFDIPDWVDTVLVTGTLAGLPVALVLGWFFDLRGGAVERTHSLDNGAPRSLRLVQGAALLGILAITALLAWYFLFR